MQGNYGGDGYLMFKALMKVGFCDVHILDKEFVYIENIDYPTEQLTIDCEGKVDFFLISS